jgi:hypothetical protein
MYMVRGAGYGTSSNGMGQKDVENWFESSTGTIDGLDLHGRVGPANDVCLRGQFVCSQNGPMPNHV